MDLHLLSLRPAISFGILAVGLFALSGCGSVTETFSATSTASATSSQEIYIVFTTDSQAGLNLINTANQGLTKQSGDKHQGTKLCSTTLTHANHSYALTIYVKGAVLSGEGQFCSKIKTESTASSTSSGFWTS